MSLRARRELCESIAARYRRSHRKEKKKILDEFASAAGYHRKHAIRALGRDSLKKRPAGLRAPRPPRLYNNDVQDALVVIWKAANRICSKRLIPYLPTFVDALERHGHLDLDADTRRLLLAMSAATADRLLYSTRHAGSSRPRARASRSPTLKSMIPVRTFKRPKAELHGFTRG